MRFCFSTLILLSSVFCFVPACKKDSSYFVPTITLTASSVTDGSKLTAGDSAKIEFTINASEELTTVQILNTLGTKIQTYTEFKTNRIYTYSFLCVAGYEYYKIIVTDKAGTTTCKYLSVTTSTKIAAKIYGTVTDLSGNSYKTVVIGTQTWMVQNLRTEIYNDTTIIPNVKVDTIWNNLSSGAQCSYSNTQNSDSLKNLGRLYNWYAVSSGKLCPNGWHVPSQAEWLTLNTYLTNYGYGYGGSGDDIAKSMASTTSWNSSTQTGDVGNNQSTNNSSGFFAVPSGERNDYGNFVKIGDNANWWTSTVYYTNYAYYNHIGAYNNNLDENLNHKNIGLSVRCIKN